MLLSIGIQNEWILYKKEIEKDIFVSISFWKYGIGIWEGGARLELIYVSVATPEQHLSIYASKPSSANLSGKFFPICSSRSSISVI